MHIVSDTTTSLSDLWNHMAAEIEDKLAHASNNTIRADIMQEYLLQQLISENYDARLLKCLQQVQYSEGSIKVSDLTDRTGLSQRHLSRKFQQYIGLSPKEYLRISRFLRSLSYLKKYPDLSLTAVAYENSYYDQAHFNRDFKTYTGHTPGAMLTAKNILY